MERREFHVMIDKPLFFCLEKLKIIMEILSHMEWFKNDLLYFVVFIKVQIDVDYPGHFSGHN